MTESIKLTFAAAALLAFGLVNGCGEVESKRTDQPPLPELELRPCLPWLRALAENAPAAPTDAAGHHRTRGGPPRRSC